MSNIHTTRKMTAARKHLPKEAWNRLNAFFDAAEAAYAPLTRLGDERNLWHRKLMEAESQIAKVDREVAVKERHRLIKEEKLADLWSARDETNTELHRLTDTLEKTEAAWQHLARQRDFVSKAATQAVETALSQKLKIKYVRGRVRSAPDVAADRVDEIRTEIRRLETAPIPSNEAKVIAGETVSHLAGQIIPKVSGTIAYGEAPRLLIDTTDRRVVGNHLGITPGIETEFATALMAKIAPDALIEIFENEIDATADDDNAIPAEGRDRMIENLRAELLGAERELVAAHDAEIGDYRYPPGISGEALLGISVA